MGLQHRQPSVAAEKCSIQIKCKQVVKLVEGDFVVVPRGDVVDFFDLAKPTYRS